MQQLENELAQTQTNLDQATTNLEEKEKALQNVSYSDFVLIFREILTQIMNLLTYTLYWEIYQRSSVAFVCLLLTLFNYSPSHEYSIFLNSLTLIHYPTFVA